MPKPTETIDELFPEPSPQTELALQFAQAVAGGELKKAHAMLSTSLRAKVSAPALGKAFKAMTSYGEGSADAIQVVMSMAEWPDKKRNDVEWVHVAIGNDTYSEAVTVVVSKERGHLVIRSLEWGRP